jgi:hypothetical protein
MLVLALNEFGYLNWLGGWFGEFGRIFVAWLGLAIIVHLVGDEYTKRFTYTYRY